MDATLRTPGAVIAALGGVTLTARKLGGLKLQRVSNWRWRGYIPSNMFDAVNAVLAAEGKPPAARSVFDMLPPPRRHTNGQNKERAR